MCVSMQPGKKLLYFRGAPRAGSDCTHIKTMFWSSHPLPARGTIVLRGSLLATLMRIEENIPLGTLTTFYIGGPARFFVRVKNIDELKESIDFARDNALKIFILGGGSNVLVDDAGFDGLVIKIELTGVERLSSDIEQRDTYVAAAGERWDALVARATAMGLWGLENLSGIPGSVGGAVVQNIGAYGAALSQTLAWVEVYDTASGAVVRLSNAQCAFGYRDSVFKHFTHYVILRAAFEFSPTPSPNLEYRDLTQRFEGQSPSLQEIRDAVLDIRAHKFPDLAKEGTAGSFFLNPMVSKAQARALQERYPDMPLYTMPETAAVKVPLGWLLDRVLNLRGLAVGKARLFERQALVIAAARGASAADVKALAQKVTQEVKDKIGITISEEVRIL